MSNSLQPHGLQHTRLPCPSLSCRVCSNSCPLSWWCYPTISICITPFSACPQIFPASGSFPITELFASGGQNIGASAPILPMNIWGWILLALSSLNSLLSEGLSRVFSSTTIQSISSLALSILYSPALKTVHDYWKNHSSDYKIFVSKVISLLFNMLSRFVVAFLPRRKSLLIPGLQSPSTVILEPKKISLSLFPFFPYLLAMKWWDGMPLFCWV